MDIVTYCDHCDAPITETDLLDGEATTGGWDHPTYGAMPAECVTCHAATMTPWAWRAR